MISERTPSLRYQRGSLVTRTPLIWFPFENLYLASSPRNPLLLNSPKSWTDKDVPSIRMAPVLGNTGGLDYPGTHIKTKDSHLGTIFYADRPPDMQRAGCSPLGLPRGSAES